MKGPPAPGGGAPIQQAPPPPPAPAPWHIARNGQTLGPFSGDPITQGISSGQVQRDTLVWTVGMANWAAAGQVPQLASLFQVEPPPPPPTPTPTPGDATS